MWPKFAGERLGGPDSEMQHENPRIAFIVFLAVFSLGAAQRAIPGESVASVFAQEESSTEAPKVPENPQEGSNNQENESPPEKASPMKDFVPSEKIEPDKAVDFPADI
jgi:hypothetical protein